MSRNLKNALALMWVRDFSKVIGKRKLSVIVQQNGIELTAPCSVAGTAVQIYESVRTAMRAKEQEIEMELKNHASPL
jgi:hypothetical protein